jgi:pilus assembly protein TadC
VDQADRVVGESVTWLVAVAYVLAAASLIAALDARYDRAIVSRLGGTVGGRWARAGGLVWIGEHVPLSRTRHRLASREGDELGEPIVPERIITAKILLGVSGALLGLLAWPLGGLPAAGAALALSGAGFRLPEFRLARRLRAFRVRVADEVPGLLDLLAVCVTAGLSPSLALERAVEITPRALRETLVRARREVALGGSWRRAIGDAADRLDLPDLRRLALALERGQRLGAPLAEQLRRLARDVRAERRSLAEERARRAPVLMLFPLVFLILPAFVLAAVIPAVMVAARGIP